MSVIIRLQNLPWSANALDIRQFFQGLSIPDGGVHIVGGEMGDAFIAFSTDEDARQAMTLDRGKLKEIQIRLLLSSRAEMQKVIETARQTSLAMMQAAQQQQQQQQQLQQQTLAPQPVPVVQVPQPPVITPTSLNKILLQQTNENSVQSYPSFTQNDNSLESRDSKENRRNDRSDRDRSRDRERDRGRGRFGRSRSRSKSRDRRRSRSRERSSRYRRDRSRSRSRTRNRRNRRSRSNERGYDRNVRDSDRHDRGDRNSDRGYSSRRSSSNADRNSIEKNSSKQEVQSPAATMPVVGTIGALGNLGPWNQSPTQPVFQTNMTKGYNTAGVLGSITQPNPIVASLQSNDNLTQKLHQQQQEQLAQKQELLLKQQQQQPIFSSNMQASKDLIGQEKPIYNLQSFFNRNQSPTNSPSSNSSGTISKPMAFQNPYITAATADSDSKTSGTNFTGLFNREDSNAKADLKEGLTKTEIKSESSITNPEGSKPTEINYDALEGNCIKVSNMCPSTTYSELRRFFSGLYISNNGIKMVNDKHGLRIGVAYIRFVRKESKPKAFSRNGSILKSNRVTIESITEQEFDEAVDSFKPPSKRPGESRFSDDRFGSSRNRDRNSSPSREQVKEREAPEFKNLCLEDVPVFAKEQDIMKMFSSYTLTDIVILPDEDNRKQLLCYVKFHRADDAKKALNESGTHVIGHKKVFVMPCLDERFDRAKDKYNTMQMEEEPEDEDEDDTTSRVLEIDEDRSIGQNENADDIVEDTNKQSTEQEAYVIDESSDNAEKLNNNNNNSNSSTPQIPSLFSLNTNPPPVIEGPTDPRKRSSRPATRFSRPDDNQNKTTYALLKNCEYKATKRDVTQFFSSVGLTPVRIEILLNSRNQPSGECLCQFQNSSDAERALLQSNRYMGSRHVRVELVSEQEVAKRMGEEFMKQDPTNTATGEPMNNPMMMMLMNNGGMNNSSFNSNNMMNDHPNSFNSNNSVANMDNGNFPVSGNSFGNFPPNGNSFNNYQQPPSGNSFKNFQQSQGENPFRAGGNGMPGNMGNQGGNICDSRNMNSNNSGKMGENLDPRSGGGGGDRGTGDGNNGAGRNSSRGRGSRQSRFSDYDNQMPNSADNNMNNMNMGNSNARMPPFLGDASVDQFGQPGCVVGMENVPYKATIDDIIDFFKMFNIQPHNVIRRYNDDGTPTGDARVAFGSPMQARNAVEAKRQHKILSRTIYLTII